MNITLINGTNSNSKYIKYEKSLLKAVDTLKAIHHVEVFTPRDMDLNYCCGCWNCWTKTPGICIYKDDGVDFVKSMAKTDAFIIASPVVAGFISKEAKKLLDRFLPCAYPSIRLYDGECHHKMRYKSIDISSLILFDEEVATEAKEIIYENFCRVCKNTHSKHIIKKCLAPGEMEVALNEIISI